MINSRLVSDLDPVLQPICRNHIQHCKVEGIELLITATYRDIEQQDALYAIGRSSGDTRRFVTNARGGHSWHNFRAAYDVVPLAGGKCIWDDPLVWEKVIAWGKVVGVEAGAEWKAFPDRPHFQFVPAKLTLIEANNRFAVHGTIFT